MWGIVKRNRLEELRKRLERYEGSYARQERKLAEINVEITTLKVVLSDQSSRITSLGSDVSCLYSAALNGDSLEFREAISGLTQAISVQGEIVSLVSNRLSALDSFVHCSPKEES